MPRLWENTVDSHRASVHAAVLQAVSTLAHDAGPESVTMSGVAAAAGIGRATLYKYYADLDALLTAWHAQQVDGHLRRLYDTAESAGPDPEARLQAVLTGYAHSRRHAAHGALPQRLHEAEHVKAAHASLEAFLGELLAACGLTPVEERVAFALHSLDAAQASQPSDIPRLVARVMAGLRVA